MSAEAPSGRGVLVQIRLARIERDRWARAASVEGLRLGELIRLAVRERVREGERLRVLAQAGPP